MRAFKILFTFPLRNNQDIIRQFKKEIQLEQKKIYKKQLRLYLIHGNTSLLIFILSFHH